MGGCLLHSVEELSSKALKTNPCCGREEVLARPRSTPTNLFTEGGVTWLFVFLSSYLQTGGRNLQDLVCTLGNRRKFEEVQRCFDIIGFSHEASKTADSSLS